MYRPHRLRSTFKLAASSPRARAAITCDILPSRKMAPLHSRQKDSTLHLVHRVPGRHGSKYLFHYRGVVSHDSGVERRLKGLAIANLRLAGMRDLLRRHGVRSRPADESFEESLLTSPE